jgi:hypothetical protein
MLCRLGKQTGKVDDPFVALKAAIGCNGQPMHSITRRGTGACTAPNDFSPVTISKSLYKALSKIDF